MLTVFSLVSIPQAVSTVATWSKLHIIIKCILLVSIPQAVSTVATNDMPEELTSSEIVSIPQAVSTVATFESMIQHFEENNSFNTASGKHCCNNIINRKIAKVAGSFNTASGKHCCNQPYHQTL